MHSDEFESLIDRIYEAGVVPESWPGVLAELAKLIEGFGALLVARGPRIEDYRWVGSPSMRELMEEYIAGGWHLRTARAARTFAVRHAGFVNEFDIYSREELEREPIYTEFLRPHGLGWAAATAVPVPSGDNLIIDVECRFERGPVGRPLLRRLDRLRPHLARAAFLSARLQLERARAGVEALGLVGLPAALLALRGAPLAANRLFEELMPHVAIERRERLALADPLADALFAEGLAKLTAAGGHGAVRSIPIRARSERPPMIVHLIPVRGAAHDVFSGASGIILVTPVLPQAVPNAEVLQGLFDLTPAEARVARGIGEGRTVDAIAEGFGLSRETVRSQLKAVLGKTGLGRQVDLAALLAGGVHVPAGLGPSA